MLVADPDCEKLHIGHTKNTQKRGNCAFLFSLFYEVFLLMLKSQPYMIFVLFFSQAKLLKTFGRKDFQTA